MSRFAFELATPDDDAALRALLAATIMPGNVALTFRREPGYFAASVVDGFTRQVIVARDLERDGAIVGLGTRSLRRVYWNGEPRVIGYLSELRVHPDARGVGNLVARGYQFLRSLDADGAAPFYFTTIAEGNTRAQDVLTRGRAGLPTYRDAGRYLTMAIPIRREENRRADADILNGVCVRPAEPGDMGRVLEFMQHEGPRYNLFPCVSAGEFSDEGQFRGLKIEDLMIALRGDECVGILGAWDQGSFRQAVVHGYQGSLKWLRGGYNAVAKLRGAPRMPDAGETLQSIKAALVLIAEDDARVFKRLFAAQVARIAQRGAIYFLIGLHERSLMVEEARQWAQTTYATRLYYVGWDDAPGGNDISARTPYLELGSL